MEYGGVQHVSTINGPINAGSEVFGVVLALPEMLGGWGLQPWTFERQVWDPLVNQVGTKIGTMECSIFKHCTVLRMRTHTAISCRAP